MFNSIQHPRASSYTYVVDFAAAECCKKTKIRKGSGHIKVSADPLVESTPFKSELQTHQNSVTCKRGLHYGRDLKTMKTSLFWSSSIPEAPYCEGLWAPWSLELSGALRYTIGGCRLLIRPPFGYPSPTSSS
jgi:hypothetical protein